ncbi:MAG: LLM class flavin-dependent oxidoreductase [Actinobacteria bacterium]|nr:LLM class flavin-dependent oxidoreductase [Actinomycetota bacterium]
MQIGLALPHYDFSFPDGRAATVNDAVIYAQRAEQLGFDSLWVSDHLFLSLDRYGGPARRYGTPEAMTLLTAIAAATSRARVGTLVLNVSFRHPRILAEQIKTIDEMSARRVELGLGAGWNEAEFDSAGIPFGTAGQRMERLSRVTSFLDGMVNPRVPLWIGGKGGPKGLGIVAESADGWNVVWRMEPQTYKERLDVLAEQCDRFKRDPGSVQKSVGFYCLMGEDDADLARRFEAMRAFIPGLLDNVSLEEFARGALVGTPERCAEQIREFDALGVSSVILAFGPVPFAVADDEQLDIAAEQLFPLCS